MPLYDINRHLSRSYWSSALEKVHSFNLNREIPQDQEKGLHLRTSSNRLMMVSSSLWSKMMMGFNENTSAFILRQIKMLIKILQI